ncbi:uncharacterized protein LOC105156010 [Sesamum indicum]|uniref:Uncharacterized protein LOC105156010 n=1 Tax=Sesamum indicum TaxID=4182 RepID=A0A6I9SKR6_SESIN|nr:uncharacterized protein LOC105156010 [Sesamum indicum]
MAELVAEIFLKMLEEQLVQAIVDGQDPLASKASVGILPSNSCGCRTGFRGPQLDYWTINAQPDAYTTTATANGQAQISMNRLQSSRRCSYPSFRYPANPSL